MNPYIERIRDPRKRFRPGAADASRRSNSGKVRNLKDHKHDGAFDLAIIPDPDAGALVEGQNLLNRKRPQVGLPRTGSVGRSLCSRNHDSAPGHWHGEARYSAEKQADSDERA